MPIPQEIDILDQEILGQDHRPSTRPQHGRIVPDAQENILPPDRERLSDKLNEPAFPQFLNRFRFQEATERIFTWGQNKLG